MLKEKFGDGVRLSVRKTAARSSAGKVPRSLSSVSIGLIKLDKISSASLCFVYCWPQFNIMN